MSYETWEVVNASQSKLDLICTREELYSDDDGFWFWEVSRFTLLYRHHGQICHSAHL